jgi:Phage integrase family
VRELLTEFARANPEVNQPPPSEDCRKWTPEQRAVVHQAVVDGRCGTALGKGMSDATKAWLKTELNKLSDEPFTTFQIAAMVRVVKRKLRVDTQEVETALDGGILHTVFHHILLKWGDCRVADLDPVAVTAWAKEMNADHSQLAHKCVSYFRRAIEWGMMNRKLPDVIYGNPVQTHVAMLGKYQRKRPGRSLDSDEVREIWKLSGDPSISVYRPGSSHAILTPFDREQTLKIIAWLEQHAARWGRPRVTPREIVREVFGWTEFTKESLPANLTADYLAHRATQLNRRIAAGMSDILYETGWRQAYRLGGHAGLDCPWVPEQLIQFEASRLNGGYPAGAIFRLLMLTGLRHAEVRELEWDELHFDWNGKIMPHCKIPVRRMKARRIHYFPLTPRIIDLLQSLPNYDPAVRTGPYVFSPDNGRSKLLQTTLYYYKYRNWELPEHWIFHDTRHTNSTLWFTQLNVEYEVQRMAQAHKLSGMGAIYIDIDPKVLDKIAHLYLQWHKYLFNDILAEPTLELPLLEAPRLRLEAPV